MLLGGPTSYTLFHGPTRIDSPGVTAWRYVDDGQFTHSLTGGGSEHDSVQHRTIWGGVFDNQRAASATVNVANVSPLIRVAQLSASTINEGDTVNASMLATDPGNDLIQFMIHGLDAGTGGNVPNLTRTSSTIQLGPFSDEGFHRIVFSATDDDGAETVTERFLRVNNVPPTIDTITGNLSVGINEEFSFSASASDPGVDDFLTFGWDLNSDGIYYDFMGPSGIHSFQSAGAKEVRLQVNDGDGGTATGSLIVTVVPDYNFDGSVDVDDIDLLVSQIVRGGEDTFFDLNDDGTVDTADLSSWLSLAAEHDGFGNAYLPGDANLDGSVNASDLSILAVALCCPHLRVACRPILELFQARKRPPRRQLVDNATQYQDTTHNKYRAYDRPKSTHNSRRGWIPGSNRIRHVQECLLISKQANVRNDRHPTKDEQPKKGFRG